MAEQASEVYDLLIVVDCTASMGIYLTSLQKSLPRIISISALTGCFSRIGLLGYRDYDTTGQLLEWSGWADPTDSAQQSTLLEKARALKLLGGYDWPEALKTGLARAHELVREEATTLVFLYADAPPHVATELKSSECKQVQNHLPEQQALSKAGAFGGYGKYFRDWAVMGSFLQKTTPRRMTIVTFLPVNLREFDMGFFVYLGVVTGGATCKLELLGPDVISKLTIEALLAWMGVQKAGEYGDDRSKSLNASLLTYNDTSSLPGVLDEKSEATVSYFPSRSTWGSPRATRAVAENISKIAITADVLVEHLPTRKTPVGDFAQRWKSDEAYRKVAVEHLERIVREDVQAIATNPVFGTLWRAFCHDRLNPRREMLLTEFSRSIGGIHNEDERKLMTAWLKESYNFSSEILEILDAVPEDQRFPCVCLDPTLQFERASDAGVPITSFTRDELLEIGRSCDPRTLSRLSKVFTRLTYVQTGEDLPAHIAEAERTKVPLIPMALTDAQHGRKFWKILLHVILPGTLIESRPAALLAALTLTLGIAPLTKAAETEVLPWRDRWNNLDVPENWNSSCLSMLLDADNVYRRRNPDAEKTLLKNKDRILFQQLIAVFTLEHNLLTPLTARVGWTPTKAVSPIGPLRQCRGCQFPRSVTIMRDDAMCGLCLTDFRSPEHRTEALANCVSMDHSQATPATWVECSMGECRAQYVVYNPNDLNVRAKCHFCRSQTGEKEYQGPAPCVECTKCKNRMIWPEPLRPLDFKDVEFICPACMANSKTIEDVETSAWELCRSSADTSWLVEDTGSITAFPLNADSPHSIFKIISRYPLGGLDDTLCILPDRTYQLSLRGKKLHNIEEVRSCLQAIVSKRRIGRDVCSMCFSDFRRTGNPLSSACGRRGCQQKTCPACLKAWYGLNEPGKVLNTAALHCPFCRRLAAVQKLRRYGNGVHAVAQLQQAIADSGQWVYAWCVECGHAKQLIQRLCGGPSPPVLDRWMCEPCHNGIQAVHHVGGESKAAHWHGKINKCPGCGIKTEKIDGCNHIECPMCATHWCFVCGWSGFEIYEHMLEAHGGPFLYEEVDSEEE